MTANRLAVRASPERHRSARSARGRPRTRCRECVAPVDGSGGGRALVQVVGQEGSEIIGPAFDPSGTRLYFSSQRGGDGGLTYEITGPFHAPR